jgi:hypothetical protein
MCCLSPTDTPVGIAVQQAAAEPVLKRREPVAIKTTLLLLT